MTSLIIERRSEDGVLELALNRPKVMNALNTELLIELARKFQSSVNDSGVRVIVLTGNERAFAAGADIEELKQVSKGTFPEEQRQEAWAELRSFPKPVIAAVNGFALGGGCELMMVADIVVASRTATFGQPEVKLGIMPGAGGTQILTRLVGRGMAMKMNLTGCFIDAYEAQRLGMVTDVVEPELTLEYSINLAKEIASHSLTSVKAIKASILNCTEVDLTQGLLQERRAFLSVVASEDAEEGISAFLEKRKPKFNGSS